MKSSIVTVGDAAPDFTLPLAAGGQTTLNAHRGRSVVLLFYRGHW